MCTPLPAKTKDLNELIDERILDLQLTAGNPSFSFSDAYRMAARARIDELERLKKRAKDVRA